MISLENLSELKLLSAFPDTELLLLFILRDYHSANFYLETSDLLQFDFDSAKIYASLSQLKDRGVLTFQASSLTLNWSNSYEENRLDLSQIRDNLETGVLTEEQAFYYELLLQKTPGQSQQIIEVYNWSGINDYSAVQITRLAYDWSRAASKFFAISSDWLIFWEKDFSSFISSSSPPSPPPPPPPPPSPLPSPSPSGEFSPAVVSVGSNTPFSLSVSGLTIANEYVLVRFWNETGSLIFDVAAPVVDGNLALGIGGVSFGTFRGYSTPDVAFTNGQQLYQFGSSVQIVD